MDRPIDPALRRARRTRRIVLAVAVIGAIAVAFAAAPRLLTPTLRRGLFRTGIVSLGQLELVAEATATVVPRLERALSSPVDARITRVLARVGDTVQAGEELLVLDTSATRLEAERLADRIAQKRSESRRLALEQERRLREVRGRLEARRLELDLAASRTAQYRTLHAEGLASADTLHQAEVTMNLARIEVAQLEDALEVASRTDAAQRESLELETAILRKEAGEVRHRLDLATMRAAGPGVVTYVATTEGTTVRQGDVLARVADLTSFRVEAALPEVHAARLALGQPVRLLLAGAPLGGRVDALYPAVENGAVRFSAQLDDPADRRLRHNLRADLLVITGIRPKVLRVPRGPSTVPGASVPVFVVSGDEARRRTVRFGRAGPSEVEVEQGLAAGEEVIVSDMQDHAHLARVRLEDRR